MTLQTHKTSGLSILVAEDSATQAEQLRCILEARGHRVRVATNGREALEEIKKNMPELVITDIVMPEMNGYQLCSAIRTNEMTSALPVVLLTSLSNPKNILLALECGADNFITKPYDNDYLVARLESIMTALHRRNEEQCEIPGIAFENEYFHINTDRQRILDLLTSSYESAFIKNRELNEAHDTLKELNLKLEIALDELSDATQEAIAMAEENKRLYEEMKELSLRDPLTGLANRRMLDISSAVCLARADRFGSLFSVLLLDIDHFKQYNDSKGHDAGDRILVQLTSVLVQSIRATDLASRYGGEEFLILMSDTLLESAAAFAERLRVSIEDIGITVSIGVAQHQPKMSFEELVKVADDTLYRAKSNGRNRVEVSS